MPHQDFISIPMKVLLQGNEITKWFNALRNLAQKSSKDLYENENNFSNDDFFTITGVSKQNFQQMFEHCHPVVLDNGLRRIKKTPNCLFRQDSSGLI